MLLFEPVMRHMAAANQETAWLALTMSSTFAGNLTVLGSALGPLVAGLLVETLSYRGLFGLLGGIAGVATLIVLAFMPETLPDRPLNLTPKPAAAGEFSTTP